MLEVMFKYVAVGIVAPLLAPFALFRPTRPFTVAGMRIVIGAFFTMLFTGGALGFTMTTVDYYADKIYSAACKRLDDDDDAKQSLSCPKTQDGALSAYPKAAS
ncbi:type IV secretion system protein [Ferrovibrio sp.]|uniref:type IV secretion system protein n=1 Tax=Ferrovibrio sp. TaxID=1917215 RepID=UPI0039C8A180